MGSSIAGLIAVSPIIVFLICLVIYWIADKSKTILSENKKKRFSARKARRKSKKEEKKNISRIVDTCLRHIEERSNEGFFDVTVFMRSYYSNTTIGEVIMRLVEMGYVVKYDSSDNGHINSISINWFENKKES